MNHNAPRYYIFIVNHKDELQAQGNLHGYIDYKEAIEEARRVRRPSKYAEPPTTYIFKATPIWKFDDDDPQGVRIQGVR